MTMMHGPINVSPGLNSKPLSRNLPDGADEDNGNTIAGERTDAFGATVEFWDRPFKLPEPLFRFFSETPWTRPSEFSLLLLLLQALNFLND